MKLELSVYSSDLKKEENWARQIRNSLEKWIDVNVSAGSIATDPGQVIFIDGTDRLHGIVGARQCVDRIFEQHEKKGRVVFLIVDEKVHNFPELLLERKVDDVILSPLRPLEVLSKVQNFEQILLWTELSQLNASLSEVLGHLQMDLSLAERLQKKKLPKRFKDIAEFDIFHRYLVGMRSGGDYFDLAETQDQSRLSIVQSNSSSYGLCNSILSILMRTCLKVSVEQLSREGSTSDLVERIYQEIILTLGDREFFSLFFGTLNKDDLVLRYSHFGEGAVLYAAPGQLFQNHPCTGSVISKGLLWTPQEEGRIQLHPRGRLVLLSGGFVDLIGGEIKVSQVLNELQQGKARSSEDLLNELTYRVKSKIDEDGLPIRDCTATVFDVYPNTAPQLRPISAD